MAQFDKTSKGYFDGSMPREVLEYYLAHAASGQWLYSSESLDDDIRVILKMGLKFIGRATGIWKGEMPEEEHFALAKKSADKVHAADPEVILQACIFEALYREDVEQHKIPAFVFDAFGLPFEDRLFNYDECVFGPGSGTWDIMPDISKLETQMWFYYRGVRYIDCGYEAFHMGQVHLYTANDRGYDAIAKVIGMLREYGAKHARRRKVLFDAHSHSLVKNGKSLLDYNAMPFTRYPVFSRAGEKLVLVREGRSGGGISPEGVYEESLPFLYEYDNWGGRDVWAHENQSYEQLAWNQWWGGDQISWFASQPSDARDKFLEYSLKWTAINNPDGFFAFPLMRGIGTGCVGGEVHYRLNDRSEACPEGFGQEDVSAKLMREGYEKYRKFANPSMLDFGGKNVDDPKTGVRLPEKVCLYGSFQPLVGATENDSNSEITRMYYIGDGKYSLSFIMPYKGEYDFAVSTWGTLSACASISHPLPFSGTGNKSKLVIPEDNSIVRVTYEFMTNKIEVEMDCYSEDSDSQTGQNIDNYDKSICKQKWMISANGELYDHAAAFAKFGYIDWRQNAKYNLGDEVYIYCKLPIGKIKYKAVVEKANMSFDESTNDKEFWHDLDGYMSNFDKKFARLRLIEQSDCDQLNFYSLKKHGLKNAPQGAMRVTDELAEYIDRFFDKE